MRHLHAPFLLATTLGLSTLNCSGDDGTLPANAGTSGTRGNTPSGAGTPNVGAGTGGTTPGAVGASGGHASGAGGAPASAGSGAGTNVTTGGGPTLGAGGFASGGAASSAGQAPGSAGASVAGASAAGTGTAAGASGAAGASTGQAGAAAAGASGSAGSAAEGPCGPVSGATFAQVQAVIAKSCGTSECHPNSKGEHSDLHNTDGKLHARLLGSAPVSVKKECQNRPLIVPCSPETSLVMQKLGTDEDAWAGCGKGMPFECPEKRECLSATDVETIRSWIAAGALP